MGADRPLLIVNPRSGGGLDPERWGKLSRPIAEALGAFDTRFTEGHGDGRRLGREAAAEGRALVVAVGGDGTISEVADGLLAHAEGGAAGAAGAGTALGIIPRGTGGDFRRTLASPSDVGAAARRIAEAAVRRIDAGRATFTGPDGAPATRHFVNVASFGFSSAVASRANASSKRLGGRVSYSLSAVTELFAYDNTEVTLRCDGGERRRRTVLMAAMGNGRCFGGGMKICPEAKLDDGLLDLVVVGDMGRLAVLANLPRLFAGTHLSLRDVQTERVRRVEVEPIDATHDVPIELDGETPGRLPATFEILPAALPVRF